MRKVASHLTLQRNGSSRKSSRGNRKFLPLVLLGGLVLVLAACGTQLPPEAEQGGQPQLQPQNHTTTSSQGNTISYFDGARNRIYSFVRGRDGHLHVNYWNGYQWQWADQGTPAGAGVAPSGVDVVGRPKAITYQDESGRQRIYVFTRGRDNRLYVNYWNGYQWRWASQGAPAGTTVLGNPEVITYQDEGGKQRIYAFVKGVDNRLYVNYWNGYRWSWASQGTPPGITAIAPMKAITYRDSADRQRIYVFANSGGNLYVNYWDGYRWRWADQGRPPNNLYLLQTMGVTTFYDAAVGAQKIYAFAKGADGRIYLNYWDGGSWKWRDLGAPPDITLYGSAEIAAGHYGQPFYAFFRGSNGYLYALEETNSTWYWRYQGAPVPYTTLVGTLLGTTYYYDGGLRIYTFVKAYDGSLRVNYRSNGQWNWANQGIR